MRNLTVQSFVCGWVENETQWTGPDVESQTLGVTLHLRIFLRLANGAVLRSTLLWPVLY